MSREFSSFRDPSGIVFKEEKIIYRQVNTVYKSHYDFLVSSGLYESLVKSNLLVKHSVVERDGISGDKYLVIQPEPIPFISYPYEWSFNGYRDAALITLKIQEIALNHGMALKDASAYNVQFLNGQPVFIDTLSFEIYREGRPWEAYGQFCRHFLAPLLLMAHVDVRLSGLMQSHIDGIPLDIAAQILGRKGGLTAWMHIHLHSRSISKHQQKVKTNVKEMKMSKSRQIAMIQSLIRTIEKMKMKNSDSQWGDYYDEEGNNYNENALNNKENIVKQYFNSIGQKSLTWDFGANNGRFSRIALQYCDCVVAFDIDPIALNQNYITNKNKKEKMLPLLLDLTNPSPSIGFANRERKSIDQRGKPDVIIMLAIIHHLAISNNLPFTMIAEWVASLCKHLVIEFVLKEDSQVQFLLSAREDIFVDYTIDEFEAAFLQYFTICEKNKIDESNRVLYLMETIGN